MAINYPPAVSTTYITLTGGALPTPIKYLTPGEFPRNTPHAKNKYCELEMTFKKEGLISLQ